jgi:hypothetical protein
LENEDEENDLEVNKKKRNLKLTDNTPDLRNISIQNQQRVIAQVLIKNTINV